MALQVNITNISQVTYPVDVYVCRDCPNVDCTLVDTIYSVPASITIPSPYDTYPLFGVKIIDAKDCEYCQIFQSGTTTTSSTSTSTSTSTTLNPICESCDIGFDFYDTNPIAEISVGLITASCDPSITDYVIEWYGPGIGSTNLAFTSGYGTDYTGDYLYSHPLTGTSSVPVVAGVYTPIIQKIKLNGIEYTSLNCFNSTTVDVDALTCDNGGTTDRPQYSHKIEFDSILNQTPQPVTSTFLLDPLKKYFAIEFGAETIYDTLKITFFGSSYSDPIIVENISCGTNLISTNFDLNLFPKRAKNVNVNGVIRKVLNLNNFTINGGDYLEIEVTPNPLNNNTNWKFYCKCLESIDCSVCYDTNITQPVKIKLSTLTSNLIPCDKNRVVFGASGCTVGSDLYKYMLGGGDLYDTSYKADYYGSNGPFFNQISPILQSGCSTNYVQFTRVCDTPSTSTITYKKSVVLGEGLIEFTFSDYSDLLHYKNNWDNTYMSYSGNPTDCTDPDYYRYFTIQIPLASGSQQCGDTTGYKGFSIHPSAVVTTGGTGPWTMSITMPTITDCISFTTCQLGCDNDVYNLVTSLNVASTGLTNNTLFTTNTGSKLVTPITFVNYLTVSTNSIDKLNLSRNMAIPKYLTETIPYSGSPETLIPSLSAQTCDFSNWTLVNFGTPSDNVGYYTYLSFYYQLRSIDPLNIGDYEIWAPTFSNGTWVGYPLTPTLNKIYDYIGGVPTVYDPSYFV